MPKSHRRSKFAIGGISPVDSDGNRAVMRRTRASMRKAKKATARSLRQSQRRAERG